MAGVLFVVCVPTFKYETEITESLKPKIYREDEFLNSSKNKSNFHKSESCIYNNNINNSSNNSSGNRNSNKPNNLLNTASSTSGLNQAGTKLFRAVTESALDNKSRSEEMLNVLIPPTQKQNTLLPPQVALGASSKKGGSSQFLSPTSQKSQSQNTLRADLSESTPALHIPTLTVPTSTTNLNASKSHLQETDLDEDEFFLQYDKIPMEKVLTKVLTRLKIENAVWCPGKNNNYYQVIFSTGSGEPCEECLQCLQDCGIGQRLNSVVSVIPCSLYYEGQESEVLTGRCGIEGSSDEEMGSDEKLKDQPGKQTAWSKFVSSVRARLTVAQVVEQVRGNAELTFDFFMLLLVAGLVAALGLVENSSVILVASMLISPLMGPILAGTFGTVIQDRQLQRVGVLHELFGLLMCLVIGFFFGLVIASIVDHWGNGSWPTAEMTARGELRSLWVGCLIALPSGAGVALSVLGGNAGSLVGVAISASLLPPAVNAGLLWALAVIELLRTTSDPYHYMIEEQENATMDAIDAATGRPKWFYYEHNKPADLAALGAVSLCLTLLNILCIFVAGIIVLKVKEVAPKSARDDMNTFWKHDIKIARDYNRTMAGEEGKNLGKQLMEELAGMSSEKLNAVVDEATRDNFIDRIRRLSLMNNGPNYNDLTYTSNGYNRNQSTWSPNSGSLFEVRPSVQELEELYATLTGHRPRSYAPLPMSMQPPRRMSVSVTSPRRVSLPRGIPPLPRHIPEPVNNHLATIMEGNTPNASPLPRHTSPRRSSSGVATSPAQPAASPREGSMRFVVTPAADDALARPRKPSSELKPRKSESPSKKFSF